MLIDLLDLPLPKQANDHRYWCNVHGLCGALAIVQAAQKYSGLTLVITPSSDTADQLHQAINFFNSSNGSKVTTLQFPSWETLPYDVFSPHHDIVSQRVKTLFALPNIEHGILIITAPTLLQRLAPPNYYIGRTLILDQGQTFNIANTRQQFEQAGYICVDNVYETGEFAVRGSIIDIFPIGSTHPYRIE